MKRIFSYSVVIILFLSLVLFNLPSTFGEKIDYKRIFENDCKKCHGQDGKGSKRGKGLGVADFTDHEWQTSVTDEQLIKSITEGKKKMPAQKDRLSPEEIKEMVRYIRMFDKKKKR